jgi:hypothetical protein
MRSQAYLTASFKLFCNLQRKEYQTKINRKFEKNSDMIKTCTNSIIFCFFRALNDSKTELINNFLLIWKKTNFVIFITKNVSKCKLPGYIFYIQGCC